MKNFYWLLIVFVILTIPFDLIGQGKVSRALKHEISTQQNRNQKQTVPSSNGMADIEKHLFSLVAIHHDKLTYLSPEDWNMLKHKPEYNSYNILGILIPGSRFFRSDGTEDNSKTPFILAIENLLNYKVSWDDAQYYRAQLPSAGQAVSIYMHIKKINEAIMKYGGEPLLDNPRILEFYWTNEVSSDNPIQANIYFPGGCTGFDVDKTTLCWLRGVYKIPNL